MNQRLTASLMAMSTKPAEKPDARSKKEEPATAKEKIRELAQYHDTDKLSMHYRPFTIAKCIHERGEEPTEEKVSERERKYELFNAALMEAFAIA